MNSLTVLTQPFDQWINEISSLIKDGESIAAGPASTKEQYDSFRDKEKNWSDNTSMFLESSFSTKKYVNEFLGLDARLHVPQQPRVQKPKNPLAFHEEYKTDKHFLNQKINFLKANHSIISVCDLIRGIHVDIDYRKGYNLKMKKSFLLEKLYQIDDGTHHGLDIIFEGNGVPVRDYSQVCDIARSLENDGLIETVGGSAAGIWGKITFNGAQYVEEYLLKITEDYSSGPSTIQELSQKIEQLRQDHSMEHQVLFEELEELKGVIEKLDHKSFGQLLKGKLFDMVAEKVISWETAGAIFKFLFGHGITLLLN
ncbi:hypothetical protein [Dinghuibacter silviterrae]|uniref:Uncharacterized protein n=1 Tax=Dinghuibacter silviterrae TaxID=1539049 RepID=A0A4R8DJ11_9BACT|nr:hypothetical protein [Dinghuibacter silviterrae]TDW97166.1 hypothetical protein EDB95_5008 [Dinghuibacter silviterrae]